MPPANQSEREQSVRWKCQASNSCLIALISVMKHLNAIKVIFTNPIIFCYIISFLSQYSPSLRQTAQLCATSISTVTTTSASHDVTGSQSTLMNM